MFLTERNLNIIIQVGIFREYEISASEELNAFGKGTSSVYSVADIKREGRSSVYAVSEIKQEIPFSPSVLGGKKEKVHLSTYDTNVIQLGNTNNKMATPAPVQLQLPLTVSGLVFLCICLCFLHS